MQHITRIPAALLSLPLHIAPPTGAVSTQSGALRWPYPCCLLEKENQEATRPAGGVTGALGVLGVPGVLRWFYSPEMVRMTWFPLSTTYSVWPSFDKAMSVGPLYFAEGPAPDT